MRSRERRPLRNRCRTNATANLTRYRNLKYLSSGHSVPVPLVVPVPLMLDGDTDVVQHLDGRFFFTPTSHTWAPADAVKTGVESWEGLYAVLANVLQDMRGAQPVWVGWEQGTWGKVAVFGFSIDAGHAHFPIRTQMEPAAKRGFKGNAGYSAEVALDLATGGVERFVMRGRLDPGQHVSRTDVVVEFGRVQIKGQSFVGPVRAVGISVAESLLGDYNMHREDFDFQMSEDIRPLIQMTDLEFTDYREGQSNAAVKGDRAFVASAMLVTPEQVTVDQLEKIVRDGMGSDRKLAERLAQVELVERLTADRHARMQSSLPGKVSEDALLALLDMGEFEPLPRTDVGEGPAPDPATQGKMVTSAVEFVAGVMHKMPDLFATRELARFEELRVVRGNSPPVLAKVRPLTLVDRTAGTVRFSEGQEKVAAASKNARAKGATIGLDTWGTFGPILEIVIGDVLKAKIGWSHWERGETGRTAVFRFAVPKDASHYNVRFCCYLSEDGLLSGFHTTPAYHGELAINPETGAVMRLVLQADFKRDPQDALQIEPVHAAKEVRPVLRSDVLVEYKAVEIGGKQYVCPARTVSVMTSWTLGGQGLLKEGLPPEDGLRMAKKAQTRMEFSRVNSINEAEFRDYHVFRSEMKIVDGGKE